MGQSKIVTIGPVFILSDVFLAVAVVIAKAPNSLMSKRTQYVYVCTRNCPDGVLGFYFSTGHNTVMHHC